MGQVRGYALALRGIVLVETGNVPVYQDPDEALADADTVGDDRLAVVEIREVDRAEIGRAGDRDAAPAAVDKVRRLHSRQVTDDDNGDTYDTCAECSWESRRVFVRYPCPTLRLLPTPTAQETPR